LSIAFAMEIDMKTENTTDASARVSLAARVISQLDALDLPDRPLSAARAAAEMIVAGKDDLALSKRLVKALATGNDAATSLAYEFEQLAVRAEGTMPEDDDVQVLPPEPVVAVSEITGTGTSEVSIEGYREALTTAAELTHKRAQDELTFRWHLGKLVAELVPAGSKGSQWVAFLNRFAADLARIGGGPLSANSLRECRRFHLAFSQALLERAVDARLSIRNSLLLCGDDVADEVKDRVIAQAKGRRVGLNDVRRMIHIARGDTDQAKTVDAMDAVATALHELRTIRRAVERVASRILSWEDLVVDITRDGTAADRQQAQSEQELAMTAMTEAVEVWQAVVQTSLADR
jgi:hypothetical protein